MKHFILILFSLCFLNTANAQLFNKEKIKNNENVDKKFLSYGYFLGFNSYDFNFDYNRDRADIQVEKTIGFSVGLIGNMRVSDYIDIRLEPGLYITRRDLMYNERLEVIDAFRREFE